MGEKCSVCHWKVTIWQVFEEIQPTFLNMITSTYLEQMQTKGQGFDTKEEGQVRFWLVMIIVQHKYIAELHIST